MSGCYSYTITEKYIHDKIKKVRKQPRGISRNKICILIATDMKKSFALIVNHGRPQKKKNYEICKKHIMPGSLLIGDEDTSLAYTAWSHFHWCFILYNHTFICEIY